MEKEKKGKKIVVVDLDENAGNNSNGENSTPQPENSGKQKKKLSKTLKEILMNEDMKFMNNFDPELSNRERRKLTRKLNNEGKKNEENGLVGGPDKDVCDCLTEGCPGCHFPCPKCRSYKCGCDCRYGNSRVNRKWMYESIENEGENAGKSLKNSKDSSSAHS